MRTHNDLHLEDVSLSLHGLHDVCEHLLLVEAEAAGEVRDTGIEEGIGDEVGNARRELALEVPAEHASLGDVARSGHYVVVSLLLLLDEVRHVLGLFDEEREESVRDARDRHP